MSLLMATSILRKLSAWRSCLLRKRSFPSFVTPSTRSAISLPKRMSRSANVAWVSSTVSCSSAAQMLDVSSFISVIRWATAMGCVM